MNLKKIAIAKIGDKSDDPGKENQIERIALKLNENIRAFKNLFSKSFVIKNEIKNPKIK